MVKNIVDVLFKVAPFAAFLTLLVALALSPHDLSGTWSGSASRYLLGYLGVSFGLLCLIRLFLPNRQNLALVACAVIFLFVAAGVVQVLATVFVLVSCICLGLILSRWLGFDTEQPQFLFPVILAATSYTFLFTSLLLAPIHYQLVYIAIFALPIIILFCLPELKRVLFITTQAQLIHVSTALQLAGRKSFFAFILLFTYLGAYVLFPNVNSDENAVHLSLWTQLSANAFFTIDPASQVWSAAPNTFAAIHGFLSLLAGADAKGALNLLLLILLLGVVFKLLQRLDISRTEKLALVTLFLSTPLVVFCLVGLQTDLFLALMLSTACMLLINLFNHFRISTALAAIFVSALALSAKLPALTIAGPVFIGVLYASLSNKSYKEWSPGVWLKIFLCLFIAAGLALLPYVRAYWFTGNPVFPLYNEIFKSTFFDFYNFKDLRWTQGSTLSSFYGLFFYSKLFFESGNNFVGGFQYFLLAPIAIAVVIFLRIKHLGIFIVMSLCYLLPIFFSLQYLRYFFAAMPLLAVVIGALYLLGKKEGAYRRWLTISLYSTALINVVFMPGVCWIFFNSPFHFLSKKNQQQAIVEYMPEHQLNKDINAIKSNATVLFAFDRSFGATLIGKPIYNTWYANDYKKAINSWATTDDVRNALKKWNVDFIYWDQKQAYSIVDIQRNLLREVLITYGKPVVQVGPIIAFTVAESRVAYQDVFSYNKFLSLEDFKITGAPQIEAESIKMGKQDVLIKPVNLSGFRYFKYSVEFSCESATDSFVEHIDFGNGDVIYKLLNCQEGVTSYTETGLIPMNAKSSSVVLSARTEQSINVHKLSLGGHSQ